MLIKLEAARVISYASFHAGVPLISKLTIGNESDQPIKDLAVTLCIPGYMVSDPIDIERIDPGARHEVTTESIKLGFFEDNLRLLTEKTRSHLEVSIDGKQALRKEIWLLPYDEWSLDSEHRPALAAFVQPNSPAVRLVERRALRTLKDLTGSTSFEALPNGREWSSQEIRQAVEAIYVCLRDEFEITYTQAPVGYEATHQKVRVPDRVLADEFGGKGTCIDLALLPAACLEGLHLQPLVLIIQFGPYDYHALLGCWLEHHHRVQAIYTEKAALARQIASGELLVIDTIGFARDQTGNSKDFGAAIQEGARLFGENELVFALDVRASRFDAAGGKRQKITPIPFHGQPYFSEAALGILDTARQAACEFSIKAPGPPGRVLLTSLHLLLGLLDEGTVAKEMFIRQKVDPDIVRDDVRAALGPRRRSEEIVETQTYRKIKELAKLHLGGDKGVVIGECQLLLAMFSLGGRSVEKILSGVGADIQKCLDILKKECADHEAIITTYHTYLDTGAE